MHNNRVLIAGGGIGGLAFALTLHQIGVPFTVFESVSAMKPLGVGINVQPNAVRELMELGFSENDLNAFGLSVKEWALVGQQGQPIYDEPRGLEAGYQWPQYAAHRGQLHLALYKRLIELAGPDSVRLDHRALGYQITGDNTVSVRFKTPHGERHETGALLIGADGIHSAIRAQMHPNQPEIHWGGALLWRGTSMAKPLRTGSSFIGLGTHRQRMIIYPIAQPDEATGMVLTNWIAEVTVDDPAAYERSGWYKPVPVDSFIHHFEDWRYDWLDVPALIRSTDMAFENPMIDRDPAPHWVEGPVALLGDAAHPMVPTGSNGASQAIMDGRILGALFLKHGVTAEALSQYNTMLCKPISDLVLRNRGDGPFGMLNLVEERCGGTFDNIDDVVPPGERDAFMSAYKTAAGFARDTLNSASSTIATHTISKRERVPR